MKKTFLNAFVALVAIATLTTFTSCKDDEVKNDPIDVNVENPRSIAYDDENLYITCYFPRSVIRYDIEQQAITGICNLGEFQPEGIAAVGGKLYIASGYIADDNFNYSYDNKLYVVDIKNFKVVDSITVGLNPSRVKKLDNSHIVFNTLGDYYTDFGGTYIMNTNSKEISELSVSLTNFDVYSGDIYGYATTYNADYSTSDVFYKIDGNSHEATQILTDWSANDGAYGININPNNGNIMVTTNGNYAAAGDCYVFTNNGTSRMNAVSLGYLPSKAVAVSGDDILVLNEGGWGYNNAGVSRVNVASGTAVADYFASSNGRGLGDVAQDILVHDGKAYITVTFSNSIETMDINTGASTRFATAQ